MQSICHGNRWMRQPARLVQQVRKQDRTPAYPAEYFESSKRQPTFYMFLGDTDI